MNSTTLLVAVLALAFTCCRPARPAQASEWVRGKDGQWNALLLCRYTFAYCEAEAGRLCVHGWDEVSRTTERGYWSLTARCRQLPATAPSSSAPAPKDW